MSGTSPNVSQSSQGAAEALSSPGKKPARTLLNRACGDCRRKKSRCDMKRPECSLCYRTGAECIYPTRRAPGRKRSAGCQQMESMKNVTQQPTTLPPPATVTNGDPVDDRFSFHLPPVMQGIENAALSPNVLPLQILDDQFVVDHVDVDFAISDFNNNAFPLALEPFEQAPDLTTINNADFGLTIHCQSNNAGASQCQSRSQDYTSQNVASSLSSIDVSPATATDLVDKFFANVHFYLPLLHQIRFRRVHEYILHSADEKLVNLPLQTAFLLCGMFALSARYSTSQELSNEEPVDRGDRFAAQAVELFEATSKELEDGAPSLQHLQATILLTFFTMQSKPSRRAWLRSAACVRLAYELELHVVDADIISGGLDIQKLSPEDFSSREERRRAWWAIWDMDTFLSFMALRPSAIGHERTKVLLPLPDHVWMAGNIVRSPYLDMHQAIPWTSLSDSPNQNPWAWFLDLTFLSKQTTYLLLNPAPSEKEPEEIAAKLTCYMLALPETFRIDLTSTWSSGREQADGMHWIISSLVIWQCLRALIAVRSGNSSLSDQCHRAQLSSDGASLPRDAIWSQNKHVLDHMRHEIAKWIRHWPAESFTQCSPLICASLIRPALAYADEGGHRSTTMDDVERQTIVFAMKRLARYWNIGKVLLEKLEHMQGRQTGLAVEPTTFEEALRRHWRSLTIW